MRDNVFLDTNILIYLYSVDEFEKQSIAKSLLIDNITKISTLVIQEMINIIVKKIGFAYQIAQNTVSEIVQYNQVYTKNIETIANACRIAKKYSFSFYVALLSDRNVLYSDSNAT